MAGASLHESFKHATSCSWSIPSARILSVPPARAEIRNCFCEAFSATRSKDPVLLNVQVTGNPFLLNARGEEKTRKIYRFHMCAASSQATTLSDTAVLPVRPQPRTPPFHALITGSTKGIGFALARKFLQDGDKVIICSRSGENVDKAVESLTQEFGEQRVFGIPADVRDGESVQRLIKFAQEKIGYIDIWASKSPMQTQKASSQSLQSPRQSRSGHLQRKETSKEQRSNDTKGKGHVVEQPPASIGHKQPSTHGLVNGQDSNEQTMRQTIPLPLSNAGCFGGGSVFQAMIRPSPALHGFMPDNAYGAMPLGGNNPMYGNIGVQPGVVPSTWVQFKQIFAPAWITNTFEVDAMIVWNQLSAVNCESLEEYNAKFWDALLPVSSFKMVTLAEQIEKYCCGLPKGIKKYCMKTSVMNMAQLMENAEVADDLIQGKPDEDGFKTCRKEPQGKQFSAKGNVTSRLTVPPFKKKPFAGNRPFNTENRPNAENQRFRPPFSGQRQGFKRHFTGKTIEERKALRDAKKCYIYEGHFANECPQRNSLNKDNKCQLRTLRSWLSNQRIAWEIGLVIGSVFMINNAGSNAYTYKPLVETNDEVIMEIVETNTIGVMICCREAIKMMMNQDRGGHIFNMDGAGADGRPTPRFAAYGATKRSLLQLTKSLQAELKMQRMKNVVIHMLSPGMVTTDLLMSGSDTPQAKFFINVLAEPADTVAEFLVPRVRALSENGSTKPTYIRFLTGFKAYSQILSRLLFNARKNRYVQEE
ncbi:hypothetical protein L7F22_027076 [Adiantum nelumboides]|nr:hypothetical protein [Adiantum nelumboides]